MGSGRRGCCLFSNAGAAALEQEDVTPSSVHFAQPLARADSAESGFGMEREAGGIFGKDSSLKGPDACGFRLSDQVGEQLGANSSALCSLRDVNADLGDAGIDAAAGYGGEGGPSEDFAAARGDRPTRWEVTLVPLAPVRGRLLEGSVSGGDTFQINSAHCLPMIGRKRNDRDHGLMIAKDRRDLAESL